MPPTAQIKQPGSLDVRPSHSHALCGDGVPDRGGAKISISGTGSVVRLDQQIYPLSASLWASSPMQQGRNMSDVEMVDSTRQLVFDSTCPRTTLPCHACLLLTEYGYALLLLHWLHTRSRTGQRTTAPARLATSVIARSERESPAAPARLPGRIRLCGFTSSTPAAANCVEAQKDQMLTVNRELCIKSVAWPPVQMPALCRLRQGSKHL